MLRWQFSNYGLALVIIIFIISFIWNWVIQVNTRHRYQQVTSSYQHNAVKFAHEYLSTNRKTARFKTYHNLFWTNSIGKKTIHVSNQAYYNNSLLAIESTLFATLLFMKHNRFWVRHMIMRKCLLFILTIGLAIAVIFTSPLGMVIGGSSIGLMIMSDIVRYFTILRPLIRQEKYLLKQFGFSPPAIHAIIRYRTIKWFDYYLSIYSEGIIWGVIGFKKWGHHGS